MMMITTSLGRALYVDALLPGGNTAHNKRMTTRSLFTVPVYKTTYGGGECVAAGRPAAFSRMDDTSLPVPVHYLLPMLDLNVVRDNLPLIEEKLRQRGLDPAEVLKDFGAIDARRRQAIAEVEALQARRNRASEEIARLKKEKQGAAAQIAETKEL